MQCNALGLCVRETLCGNTPVILAAFWQAAGYWHSSYRFLNWHTLVTTGENFTFLLATEVCVVPLSADDKNMSVDKYNIYRRDVTTRWGWGAYESPPPYETQILSLVCGNKMPTRCKRGFYCRSYCLLNMFRAPLCPSSGAQEYYTVVAACGISCCGFQVVAASCKPGT